MPPALFRHPDFRIVFISRTLTITALQVQAVLLGWQIYSLTSDPLMLGLLGLAEAAPAIGCSFFSGHLVDNHRPARIFHWSLAANFVIGLLLLIASLPAIPLQQSARLLILFSGAFLSGASRSFTSPATYALIPKIIPRRWIPAAAGWGSSSYQIAAIVGPALGGAVYASFGPVTAFAMIPILAFLAFVACFWMSPASKNIREENHHKESFWSSMQAGLKFTLGHRVLLSTMLLDMFSVLFGGAVAVLPIFADQILKSGPTGLGLLRAAPSVGSGIIVLFLALKPMRFISGNRLLFVVAGFGVSTLAFAVSTNFTFAFLFLALSGAFDGVSMVIRSTLLQLLTPDAMRGRVSALSSIFITSSNEIGAFESGLAARLMRLVPSILFGGVMTLVTVGIVRVYAPELSETKVDSQA